MVKVWWIGIVAALIIAACQPAEPALPTVASVSDIQTQNAPTAAPPSETPTPTDTPRGLVLPPTFTPTAIPPSDTPIATFAPRVTATFAELTASGTIYYIYNGDSIIAQPANGGQSTLIMTFGVGKTLTDMIASPDGTLLAFVAPGNGSAREVYITSLDGTYLQQISCLGMSNVRLPIWSPDGLSLQWFAAPEADKNGQIYTATVAGSGQCPTDNGQQILVRMESTTFEGMTWNLAGDALFYTKDDALWVFDPITQGSTIAVAGSGFGANRLPRLSPRGEIAFIVQRRLSSGQFAPNATILVNTTIDGTRENFSAFFPNFIEDIRWNSDGLKLLGITAENISIRDSLDGSVDTLVENLSEPVAIFSPSNTIFAYTQKDRRGTPQWTLMNPDTGQTRTLTQNPEGTISDPVWIG